MLKKATGKSTVHAAYSKLFHSIGSAKKTSQVVMVVRALAEYYGTADSAATSCAASDSRPLACRERCAFCCHIPVGARAQQVLLIADFIRSNFSPNQQAALTDRLRKHVATVSPLTTLEHYTTNIPCPLLDGSRCSVYYVRPLACRAYHSLDVSSCQYTFDHPHDTQEKCPQIEDLESAWQNMVALANRAFAEHDYDRTDYELGSALFEALTNPATSRRFHQGKKAFPKARLVTLPGIRMLAQ
jgi:Fe-S-cluster containining protein